MCSGWGWGSAECSKSHAGVVGPGAALAGGGVQRESPPGTCWSSRYVWKGLWFPVTQMPGKAWTPGGQENEDPSVCQLVPNSPRPSTTPIRGGNPLCAFETNTYTVTMNFMCQLDRAMGCPDIWSHVILGVSVRVFWDEMNI